MLPDGCPLTLGMRWFTLDRNESRRTDQKQYSWN
jgi:hypothetical protein